MTRLLPICCALLLAPALVLFSGCTWVGNKTGWWGAEEAPPALPTDNHTPKPPPQVVEAPAPEPPAPTPPDPDPQPKSEPLPRQPAPVVEDTSPLASDSDEPPPAMPPPAPQEKPATAMDELPDETTVADIQLQRIYNEQQRVFAQLETEGEGMDEAEYRTAVNDLLDKYQDFVERNPEYVPGFLLYGKLLRTIGDRQAANLMFLEANELDPNLAVAKQQIGNFLVEEREFALALPYFLAAIELEPDQPRYHHQLGELIYLAREDFIASGAYTRKALDRQMLRAFARAAELEPENRDYRMRYGESFFDLSNPPWEHALAHWDDMLLTSKSEIERDIILLQKARVLIEMEHYEEARSILQGVNRSALEKSRQQLLARLPSE